MQAGRIYIIIRQEGGDSHHVIPETYSVEGYVTDRTVAEATCRQKNIAEGHPVDVQDWQDGIDPFDHMWTYEEVDPFTP